MTENLDDILNEIRQNRKNWGDDPADPSAEQAATDALDQAETERRSKVASFRLNVDLEGEFGDYEEIAAAQSPEPDDLSLTRTVDAVPQPERPDAPVAEDLPAVPEVPERKAAVSRVQPEKKRKKTDPRAREVWGCAGSIFYVLLTIGVSLVLACIIIMAALDLTGLNKSPLEVKVTIEEGVTTGELADTLKENGLIDHEWIFSLYSKVRKLDGQLQSGVYTLSANMGYGNIVDVLRAGVPRTVVRVTIPEGYTIDAIAALMEDNAVCTKKSFYEAVLTGDYTDYSFIAAIPAKEGEHAGRGYALEGYLFPDTYDFYTGSSGEAVVRKLLDNFDTRVDTTYKTKIAARGMTVNDVVILASIVQGEASDGEWSRVSRVLTNRLENPAEYPRLQCDATINYYKNLDRTVEGLTISQDAYDTAVREGLTPGAICNPGMRAIDAVLAPSSAEDVSGCYYFATDYSSGITYYSKTYSQHEAVCKQYGIGMYGTATD